MIKEITLPEISENVESGEVVRVLVHEGERVEKEQAVLELETDKASFELPAPEGGRVVELDVGVGDTVKVGQLIMKVETDGAAPSAKPPAEEHKEEKPAEEKGRAPAQEAVEEKPKAGGEERREEKKETAQARPEQVPPAEVEPAEAPPPASPSVRRLARELGVDIRQVEGSGPGGRIAAEDVKGFVKETLTTKAPAGGAGWAPPPLPDFTRWGPVERAPQGKVGRLTAESTGSSWRTIPHVTHFDKADVSEFERFRKAHARDVEKHGAKLTVTALLVKVAAAALRVFPKVNSALDAERDEIVYRKYAHIGFAVDTDRGLLVPVIRDADTKSLVVIAREIGELAGKARGKQITPDEMKGACFTVSNLGGIGGTSFTPIVYHPQAAILGVARAEMQPVYRDGEFRPRLILPLSLSYDHRLVDGADGARFLRWIAEAIEEPFMLELEGGENG
jgi:pyruvate dehydrogenase E2 component (dihydrolipoamide acetyltransferase)